MVLERQLRQVYIKTYPVKMERRRKVLEKDELRFGIFTFMKRAVIPSSCISEKTLLTQNQLDMLPFGATKLTVIERCYY